MELEQQRARIDAFHARFNAAVAAAAAGNGGASAAPPAAAAEVDDPDQGPICSGCGSSIERSAALWCGACRCTAYCDKECQRLGWKSGGHKAACKLLARAKALPPADPARRYVVQLKLAGREGLSEWAGQLERADDADLAGVHRQMVAALAPRERVLFALEARSHMMLRFQVVPSTKRLEAHDLALFVLQAVVQPACDVPTLNMPRDAPQRPYAIWIPGDDDDIAAPRSMARPVGQLLAGAGLPTSSWYVGGGFCAEARLHSDLYDVSTQQIGDRILNSVLTVDPDYYTEDENSEDDGDEDEEDDEGVEAAAGGAAAPPPLRVLMVAGMHCFGPAGEEDDPLLKATAAALRAAGAQVEVGLYPMDSDRGRQEALARRLQGGGFEACVVLGLGSGSDFKPRTPTYPWGKGPWRDALSDWVRDGGVVVIHGERAAAAVAREFFGLSWRMEGDYYRRTDHKLNRANPLLADLAARLPSDYNVKACMLNDVPPLERIYASAPGAVSHSLVPFMAGESVDAGRTAMAAARCGGGAVAFFGDVNWEAATNAAVAGLTRRLVQACRRRAGP
ncbi:hypothetical protein PLESTB_000890500 [Pleodorina starrii]|uniref:MYND-type domain-containing protein n=1 Tax=Pleodorina starrii TaxID=330485 RepID=A0A9W6BMU3_9CHLO|nr:hypothetical protein PLESTB_000890500 [Pleodorina starrii]GLC66979.1 hypothetical protein PLESTF_000498300 [Pleodorina starrii]